MEIEILDVSVCVIACNKPQGILVQGHGYQMVCVQKVLDRRSKVQKIQIGVKISCYRLVKRVKYLLPILLA